MAKQKKVYFCSECGNETPNWEGRCRACGQWNTITEMSVDIQPRSGGGGKSSPRSTADTLNRRAPRALRELETSDEIRFSTGMAEFDRVLGGGAVTGSIVLVGGAPGIGKSTLMLQVCDAMAADYLPMGVAEKGAKHAKKPAGRLLYVSGEESERQIKLRAERLGVAGEGVYVLTETDIAEIISTAREADRSGNAPGVMIIDSIQTLYNPEINSAPGSVTQVKDCAMALMNFAKSEGVTVFLIGHVNKEGAIAGPMVLEHMVDCVLQFEGGRGSPFRLLRAKKNRFGSTNELGVFEMTDAGIAEVPNPSEQLLSGRPVNTPGTCVTCVVEGTMPLLAEIQALVAPSTLTSPRRNATGLDYNRAQMLLAVLEKRGGLRVGACDAFLNVIGGLELTEPGADLAAVMALASSYRDKPVGDDLIAVGEVGLTGELRAVSQLDERLAEAARLGFARCVIPAAARGKVVVPRGMEAIFARNVADALRLLS